EDRSARSAYQVAHSKAPGPGITERALRAAREAQGASIYRKFDSSLRQRVPFISAERLESCRAGRTRREVVGIGRKAASWNRLVELYNLLWIDEFRDLEVWREEPALAARRCDFATTLGACHTQEALVTTTTALVLVDTRSSPGGLAEENTGGMMRRWREPAARHENTRGVLRRRLEDRRSSCRGHSRKKRHSA
ncbi:hypothetical protein THAOC_32766, partial [Thalassiosira oceanica]